ncbi:acyltransferase [Neobacillus niacini]|uniref:acyltransferase n=1 Tax=Neobacillus niacini TaxID=86668 RepID=UPI0030007869
MERNYTIDFIKFFAILAVVIIHTFPSDHQLGFFILDNFSRFAVPFFFVASGYLFGLKVIDNPNSAAYFKKYLIKILKIYVSWLVFYICYDVIRIFINGGNDNHELSKYFEGLSVLKLLYYGEGTSGYQLWFVISLAWSIVTLYLFYRLKNLILLLVLGLCLNLAGLFGQSYSIFFEMPITTRDALFIGVFYTTVGFWFAFASPFKKYRSFGKKSYFFWFCFVTVLQASEGYWLEKVLSAKHGEYFIMTIFLTVFLFLFTVNNPELGKGFWISKIGANALGIYAVHVFFIDIVDILLSTFGLGHVSHNLLWNVIDTFLVFTLSYITYLFIQNLKSHLPFLR